MHIIKRLTTVLESVVLGSITKFYNFPDTIGISFLKILYPF